MKRDWNSVVYGPMKQKTYDTALFDLIRTEFGYIGGPDVITLFVRKIVELNNEYYRPDHYVKPGQMRWLAVRAGEKYGKRKTMRDMKLVPITLTIINEEDIEDCCNGVHPKERQQKFIKRLHQEARNQEGVLPEADAAVILRTSLNTISRQILDYEKRTGEIIPRSGTEMDMGKTLTHKRLAFHNFKKKMSTTENARSIDHSPGSVDRYVKDAMRVERLHGAKYSSWDIAFFTGLSISVVNQYIEVIDDHNQKMISKEEIILKKNTRRE